MRSSTLVAIALVAAASPALAAPVRPVSGRQVSNPVASSDSSALDIGSFFEELKEKAESAVGFGKQLRRDGENTDDTSAPTDTPGDNSQPVDLGSLIQDAITAFEGAGSNSTNGSTPDLGPLLQSLLGSLSSPGADNTVANSTDASGSDDTSGALSFGSLFKFAASALGSLFGGSDNNQRRDDIGDVLKQILEASGNLQRREDGDASEAINFGSIFKVVTTALGSLFGGGSSDDNNQRRADSDAVLRHLFDASGSLHLRDDVDSQALNLGSLFKFATTALSSLFGGGDNNQRRDDVQEVLKQIFEASHSIQRRDGADTSEAINFGSIFKIAETALGALFGGGSNDNNGSQRRADADAIHEVLKQILDGSASLQLREDADSQALGLGSLFKFALSTLGPLLGGDNNQRRDELADVLETLFSGNNKLPQRREPIVLLPGSGQVPSFPHFSAIPGFHPVILRSLNDLD
ncbi:hypothetical protein BDW22DRAFT_1429339 [Trametopsis cervina]|nr:hypothetical protein BDW22DRAFT_1429339 [Trametopsis cervina]